MTDTTHLTLPYDEDARDALLRAEFDRDALKMICEMHELDFGDRFDLSKTTIKDAWSPEDYYFFRDNGSRILAVAHLDTCVRPDQRTANFVTLADGEEVVYSGALDDRLGAYTILDLLPRLGIEVDILLTVGEESGCSTAEHFMPEKRYDWMIEFDRGGTDVVMYQYDDAGTRQLVRDCGAKPADGIFSDISYLEHLGIKGFNWGVGYRDYHSTRGHAYIEDYLMMMGFFMEFHADNVGTHMFHEPAPSWFKSYREPYDGYHAVDDDSSLFSEEEGGFYDNEGFWFADDDADLVAEYPTPEQLRRAAAWLEE